MRKLTFFLLGLLAVLVTFHVLRYRESAQGSSDHLSPLGDTLPVRAVLDRVEKVPGLRKRAEELARSLMPDLTDPEAREAAAASAAEFILEGLHVHNKLNKTVKNGATAYKR